MNNFKFKFVVFSSLFFCAIIFAQNVQAGCCLLLDNATIPSGGKAATILAPYGTAFANSAKDCSSSVSSPKVGIYFDNAVPRGAGINCMNSSGKSVVSWGCCSQYGVSSSNVVQEYGILTIVEGCKDDTKIISNYSLYQKFYPGETPQNGKCSSNGYKDSNSGGGASSGSGGGGSTSGSGAGGGGSAVATGWVPIGSSPIQISSINSLIGTVIRAILGVVGSLALLMFVFGGLAWLTSGGNEKRVAAGKDTIIWAAIGLVIVFFSYVIVKFVLEAVGA